MPARGLTLELSAQEGSSFRWQSPFVRVGVRTVTLHPPSCTDGLQDGAEDGVDSSWRRRRPALGDDACPERLHRRRARRNSASKETGVELRGGWRGIRGAPTPALCFNASRPLGRRPRLRGTVAPFCAVATTASKTRTKTADLRRRLHYALRAGYGVPKCAQRSSAPEVHCPYSRLASAPGLRFS